MICIMENLNYAALDTYEADLLNESPPRREEVTEIQDREHGDLLCYANPKHEALIIRAVNNYARLIAFVEKISKQRPEKPDYWTGCGQCEHNIEEAKELLGL
jgi:hypothetical protein